MKSILPSVVKPVIVTGSWWEGRKGRLPRRSAVVHMSVREKSRVRGEAVDEQAVFSLILIWTFLVNILELAIWFFVS